MKYIRYVVDDGEKSDEDMDGLITILNLNIKEGKVGKQDKELFRDLLDWLNEKVPVPPYKSNKDYWTIDSLAYWKLKNNEKIHEMMYILIGICDRINLKTKIIETESPGFILYEDAYQIISEKKPNKRMHRTS